MLFSAQNKLEGTLWMDVDDAKVFKILDLEDIEKTFSAYQRQQVPVWCWNDGLGDIEFTCFVLECFETWFQKQI